MEAKQIIQYYEMLLCHWDAIIIFSLFPNS